MPEAMAAVAATAQDSTGINGQEGIAMFDFLFPSFYSP